MSGLPWIKVWTAIGDHPKVQRLERELRIKDALGVVIRLWCWTADYAPTGDIPTSDLAAAAKAARGEACRMPAPDIIDALVVAGLLDPTDLGARVHDWHEMQTVHVEAEEKRRTQARERQAKHRAKHGVTHLRNRDVTRDVTRDSVTEKEKEREGETTRGGSGRFCATPNRSSLRCRWGEAMRTKGLMVVEGYLCPESVESAKGYGLVPAQLWNRLKHQITLARRMDEFKAEALEAKGAGFDAERALFVRWCSEVGFTPPPGHYEGTALWPWNRGWTEDRLDAYLEIGLRVVA